jgi:hypothetical protein
VHLDAALDGEQILRVRARGPDKPRLMRRAAADDAALGDAVL